MIQYSKIDKELTVYRINKVLLFGASSSGVRIKKDLECNGIFIEAFIDNDINKCGKMLFGIPVLTFDEAKERIKTRDNYIVQIASSCEKEIETQLKSIQANYILYSEYSIRMKSLGRYLLVKKHPDLKKIIHECDWEEMSSINIQNALKFLAKNEIEGKTSINLMVSPPKVGNVSLSLSSKGRLLEQWHTYAYLPMPIREILQKSEVNLIMGVRDILSQNFSLLFQNAEVDHWDMEENWNLGGDVQTIFEKYYMDTKTVTDCWCDFWCKKADTNWGRVQEFFEAEVEPFWGIDIYEYPFDKVRGYSIYKFGKLNMMIYQLEKMHSLENEIGEFLSISDFQLNKGNNADEKYYNEYYRKAKEQIILEQEYIDKCYSSKYMKHFYSEEDIAKYKSRWERNTNVNEDL